MFKRTYNIKAIPASRPRVTRWSTFYGKRYTQFREDWKAITRKDWPAMQAEMENTHHFRFFAEIYFDKKPKADVDNVFKALSDPLVKAQAILDDNLITDGHVIKHNNCGYDRIDLYIEKID